MLWNLKFHYGVHKRKRSLNKPKGFHLHKSLHHYLLLLLLLHLPLFFFVLEFYSNLVLNFRYF
jgi:hypothetical protein